jgi:hypothetical protein
MDLHDRRRLALLTACALMVRGVVVSQTVDMPGDAPARAVLAYAWSLHPCWMGGGVWLPLGTYVSGLADLIWLHPAWVTRLLDVVLGTLCIPLYVLLVRQTFDMRTAWGSGLVLACLPLHVALSASSMTEMLFHSLLLGALLLLCHRRLVGATGLLVAAEMTRYEAWAIAPFCLLAVAAETREWRPVAVAAVVLALFPLYWLTDSARMFGSVWYIAEQGLRGPEFARPALTWPMALLDLLRKSAGHVGWGLLILMGLGIGRGLRAPAPTGRRVLYGFACFTTFLNLRMLSHNGGLLWDRHLLLMLMLWLPFGLYQIPAAWSSRARVALAVLLAGSLALSSGSYVPDQRYVTRDTLAPVRRVVSWLRDSPYRDAAILLTRCDWMSTYVPLYYPPAASQNLIVSEWIRDVELQQFVTQHRPPIVITALGDADILQRIEVVGHCHIQRDAPLLQAAPFIIYRINP